MPGSPRLFNLCRGIAQNHRLTLMIFNLDPDRYEAFLGDPAAAGVFEKTVVMPPPPKPTWWGRQVHRMRREAHFVTRARSPRFHAEQCRRVRDVVVEGKFDAVYAEGLPLAQYVADARLECPAVIDVVDSLALLYARTRRVESRWLRKLALWAETQNIVREERSLSRTFCRIIACSEVDEAYVKMLDPNANTLTIGNGVDSDYFAPTGQTPDMSKLVFTGVMGYGPNEDAAIFFAHDILPAIRERHAEAQFFVVGNSPTDRVTRLAEVPGVHVTGGVPDVRPYLGAAGIFVCPLRFGTGVKNKILAALSMDRAVVATRLSVEGLALEGGRDLLLADDPAEFAAKVVQLIQDPEYAERLARQGRATVLANYSWQNSARLLEEALLRAMRAPAMR